MDKLQMRKTYMTGTLFRQLTHCMSYTATTRNVKHITLKHLPTRDLPLRM